MMETRKLALIVVGIILVLVGAVFALQEAGNSTYIYVGAIVAIVGLILLVVGVISKTEMAPALAGTAAAPSL